jgi:hypothetical protein
MLTTFQLRDDHVAQNIMGIGGRKNIRNFHFYLLKSGLSGHQRNKKTGTEFHGLLQGKSLPVSRSLCQPFAPCVRIDVASIEITLGALR